MVTTLFSPSFIVRTFLLGFWVSQEGGLGRSPDEGSRNMTMLSAPTPTNKIDLNEATNRAHYNSADIIADGIRKRGMPLLFHAPQHADLVEVFGAVVRETICL